MSLGLFAALFTFRLLGSLLLRTYFDPDEYWQCIEPACRLAFGQGALTWEWRKGVRSWNYPIGFALAMWLSERLVGRGHRSHIVVYAPKVVQAIVTAIIDYYTYLLGEKTGKRIGRRALLISVTSWFMFAYVNRTLSNSLEAALTAMALYHEGNARSIFVALSTIVRPTAILNWLLLLGETGGLVVPLLTCHFWNSLLDSVFYGELGLVPWTFFKFNIGRGVAEHFGVSSSVYYLTAAIPAILLTFIGYFVRGLRAAPGFAIRHISGPLVVLSLLRHKEIRFLMPLLPSLHVISAIGMQGSGRQWFRAALVLQAIAAIYFAVFFQSGPISVMKVLRAMPEWSRQVMFLMPCHSVPWTGYFAAEDSDIDWRQLECDPTTLDAEGLDESDHFYLNPQRYLETHKLPDTVVTFEPLATLMQSSGYVMAKSVWNGHWNPDNRRSGDVIIWRKAGK